MALFGTGAVFEIFLQNALDAMTERCGSAEGYLRMELALTSEELETLRGRFLE